MLQKPAFVDTDHFMPQYRVGHHPTRTTNEDGEENDKMFLGPSNDVQSMDLGLGWDPALLTFEDPFL